ncbi:MAG: short-chain fatty acid transporter [Gammaproteobacteria bacterium]|nr:short-chain fatty acid transporter [Gammaproteobacteria bacterium]
MNDVQARARPAGESWLFRLAQRCCTFFERWFPDAYAFALAAVVVVAACALAIGAPPLQVAVSFGEGFWSVIPFTMQMTFIIIGGYVTADSPPVARFIARLATRPRTGTGAVALVAVAGMLLALLHWGLSLVMASLLARALARRNELRMDYRAAGAAACIGIGSVWALGLSSSAAQLQANPASMPPGLLAVTGVIPFTETIFLWQSLLMAAILLAVSTFVAFRSAPGPQLARTAQDLGIDVSESRHDLPPRQRPGEWLEYSPLLCLLVVGLGVAWLLREFHLKGFADTIANLNTYNLVFLMLAMLLHWRPRRFVEAVGRSIPSVAGVLIQYPFLGALASMMTTARNAEGASLAQVLSDAFGAVVTSQTFAPVVAIYSALLGLAIPSGGGKWLVEGPYVMQAANDLHYHLGWTVQIYNAAEALPNLINPFWMLPVLGILGLRARDLIGFTFVQFLVKLPLVLLLLWLLGMTLAYHPPVMPP